MKKTVAFLFGGASSEHEVSLMSADSVIKNVPRDKYNVIMVGITKNGRWFKYDGAPEKILNGSWENDSSCVPAFLSPDRGVHGLVIMGDKTETLRLDAVFPVLHGKNGEDGTVQGLLELSGIPYVGCDCISSGACMDKQITNAIADISSVPQAEWFSFTRFDYKTNQQYCIENTEKLGYPIFIKPACAGSSVGVSKAADRQSLLNAIEKAFKEDDKIVAEEFIDGYEVECAVLGNERPMSGEVGQIVACNDFYDYEAKYSAPSELYIPAQISTEKRSEIAKMAVRTFKAMGCNGLSRVDFFVRKADGKILFNEINTIPGFTSVSMYPELMAAVGIEYGDLIDRLICLAIERNGARE